MNKYDLTDNECITIRSAIIEYYSNAGLPKQRDLILKKLGLDIFSNPYIKYHAENKRKLDEIDRGFQERKMKEFNKLTKEERIIEMKESKDD